MLSDMVKCNAYAISFFGTVQRIYTIFSASTKRWKILVDTVPYLTVKPQCETRWECRIESVKAIRYQMPEIRDALINLAESDDDPKVTSEAEGLINQLENFQFIVLVVVWYDLLFSTNVVSKYLQSKNMQLDVAVKSLQGLLKFLSQYRSSGFKGAITTAKELAENLDVLPVFKSRRISKKKRQFDYESRDDNGIETRPEELCKIEVFLPIIDTALSSFENRLKHFEEISCTFDFLQDFKKLKDLSDKDLKAKCLNLSEKLKNENSSDLDFENFYMELKVFRFIIDESNEDKPWSALEILKYIYKNKLSDDFSNVAIAYRIFLTIPITVASAERSFSKLKLIETFLRTTMSQERLAALSILSIEHEEASSLNFEEVIDLFSSAKSRKVYL